MHERLGRHLVLALATIALIGVAAPRDAHAQVSDHAQCGTSLPACTTLRTNCCTRDFAGSPAQKAILIPMDRCHQQIANGGVNAPPNSAASPDWCSDSPGTNVNSMNYAYGLVFRLMQQKIPVYWIVNPTKGSSLEGGVTPTGTPDPKTRDIDFWITSANAVPPAPGGGLAALAADPSPVKRLTTNNPGTASATLVTAATYSRQQFPVRGGAFLIAPDDRPAFEQFWKTQLGRSCGTPGLDCLNFKDVWLYEVDPTAKFVWQDFTQPMSAGRYYEFIKQLPVAMRIDYEAPKISLVDGNLLRNFLAAANLDDFDSGTCRGGVLASNVVGCVMTEADIQGNYLSLGGFNWLWLDINNSTNCVSTMSKVRSFLTAVTGTYTAGNAMFMNAAIQGLAEQCVGDKGTLGKTGVGLATTNSAINETSTNRLINRYPANLFAQFGDLPLNFSAGAVTNWGREAGGTSLYSATYDTAPVTLRRLMTQESPANGTNPRCQNRKDLGQVGAASTATCDDTSLSSTADVVDLYGYGRYLNNKYNGLVFYSPGNNLTPSGQQAQLRMVLSSLIATPPFTVEQVFTNTEVTRASPIVALVNGKEAMIQGSYEYHYKSVGTKQYQVPNRIPGVYVPEDVIGFTFPVFKGHLRATEIGSGSIDTTVRTLDQGSVIFDGGAANMIPPVSFTGCGTYFDGSCRSVWTTLTPGAKPDTHFVEEDNHGDVGLAMLPESTFTETDRRTFIRRILKGYDDDTGLNAALGGIDRSTVAVIGPGASVGGARPTIAYVGATDGMLHAICASVGGGCKALGQELWAYIPRVNLTTVRYNTARIDGSPRVLDVRADFYGTGATLKTVLIFQTGGGDANTPGQTPAVYALDVTDPSAPRVIWEYTTPATRGVYELGNGLTVAAGDAVVGGVRKNLVIAQTNNGGTGGAANVVTAIETDTGTRLWQFAYPYPNPPRLAANPGVPPTGIPPGAVTIDKTIAGANGFFTDIVVGDLYGNLWMLDPATGTSRYTNASGNPTPLFSFTTDFHPLTKPAIYLRNGEQYAVFTTGGYADYSTTKGWGSYAPNQYLMAVSLDTPNGGVAPPLPLTEATPSGFVPINAAIEGLGYGQARIVGDEIFVTTDSSDVNAATFGTSASDTGRLYAYDFAATSNNMRTTVVATGAGSVANSGANLYSSSGSKRQEVGFDAKSVNGAAVTAADQVTQMVRKLWLRTE